MAFVFRAEKKENKVNRVENPGPGYYDPPQKAEPVESRVPFHSTKEREFLRPKSHEYPGPGSYNVMKDIAAREDEQHVFFVPANPGSEVMDYKTSSVFKSKTERFPEMKLEQKPGPGTYNMGQGFIKKGGNKSRLVGNKNNLELVHNIIQKGNKVAPSIPSNVHSYGYTENEEKKLLLNKNPLLQVQQFVGPGYYESKQNTQGVKYHGPSWHKNSGKKDVNFQNTVATSNQIGPGSYPIEDVNLNPSYKSNPQSGFASTSTRTFDKNVKRKLGLGKFQSGTPSSQSVGRNNMSGMETDIDDEEYDDEYMKDATPGPGYYHNESLLSSFGSKTPSTRLSLNSVDKLRQFPRTQKTQAFGTSPRFKEYNSMGHEVGPGQYEVTAKPAAEGLKYIKVPFQSSNTRFERTHTTANPGPGNYDAPVNLVDRVRKKANTGYVGSFGVTEGRFKISKLLEETPGPGTYTEKNKFDDVNLINPKKQSHFFTSTSNRGVFVGKNDHQAHPGSYELDYYNIVKNKSDEDEDDGLDKPKRYPFNTGQVRFEKPKEKPIPEDDDEDDDDEPRFGTTKNLESLLKSKMKPKPNAVFSSVTGRNIGGIRNNGLPGPGAYFEQTQNIWNKRTFNIHFTGE